MLVVCVPSADAGLQAARAPEHGDCVQQASERFVPCLAAYLVGHDRLLARTEGSADRDVYAFW